MPRQTALKLAVPARADDPGGDGNRDTVPEGVSIGGVYLLDQKQLTLAALCVACVAAILTGWWLTKGTPLHAIRQSVVLSIPSAGR